MALERSRPSECGLRALADRSLDARVNRQKRAFSRTVVYGPTSGTRGTLQAVICHVGLMSRSAQSASPILVRNASHRESE